MAQQSGPTPGQVNEAIRAGLSEGRRPVRMSAGRAAERAATHRSILARYREHAQESLNAGDYLQTAEKSWGAYAQTVKAIAADHRWRATHHGSIIGVAASLVWQHHWCGSIIGVAAELASLAGRSVPTAGDALRHGLSTARSLHKHFYENDLPDEMVVASADDVGLAIDLLRELFPPGQSARCPTKPSNAHHRIQASRMSWKLRSLKRHTRRCCGGRTGAWKAPNERNATQVNDNGYRIPAFAGMTVKYPSIV